MAEDDVIQDESAQPAPAPEPAATTNNLPAIQGMDDEVHRQHKKLFGWIDSINIAPDLPPEKLDEIGQKVVREYTIDDNSRSDWKEKSKKAMDLAMQVAETKQYPWPRASNVIYPLMTVAAIQFAARAYPAIVSGRDVVKGTVVGKDEGVPGVDPQTGGPLINPQNGQQMWVVEPGARRMLAAKIGEHMSWQLLDEQPEWEEETDRLLHILPIAGCAFRKSYFDPSFGRNASMLVSAMKVVVNYHAKSLETAPRVTEEIELYPLEIKENELSDVFVEITYTPGPNTDGDDDAPHMFLEQHRWLDLDDDGYPEPYTVTVHKDMAKVVRIVARFDAEGIKVNAKDGTIIKIDPIHYYTKYDFLPNPEGGIYGVGFGQLLRPVNEAVNTTLNMMIDAGHLQVVGGGFIGKQLSMHTGAVRFTPGEYKSVNAAGSVIKDNIVPLVTPGPSAVLFQLLGTLIEAGKDISAVKDVLTGEQKSANIPATTTLALIEQGLKTFTAIYKRIHRSLKKELNKLYRLNSIHLPSGAGYRANNEWRDISSADYKSGNGVEPVSDPTMVSEMQKLGRAQFLLGFKDDPLMNGIEIRRRVLNAAMIEKVDELVAKQPPPNPELLANAAKMEIQKERMQAEATKDYAQAFLFFTQAQALVGQEQLAWVEHQLEVFKARIEALSNAKEEGSAPNSGGGLPDMEAPPGDQSAAPIHAGLSPLTGSAGVGLPAGGPLGGGQPGGPA